MPALTTLPSNSSSISSSANTTARHRRAHGVRAEGGRIVVGQCAKEATLGSTRRAEDEDVALTSHSGTP